MSNFLEEVKDLARRNAGLAAAAGLSLLASYLFTLPEALEAFYRLTAVIGGLAGYWASLAPALSKTELKSRAFIGLLAIVAVAIASLYLRWYFDQSLTPLIHDGLALVAFGASFAAACFFMGLCGIRVITPPANKAENQ